MVDGLQMTAKLKGMVRRCQEKINYMEPEISTMRQMLISMGGPAIPVREGSLNRHHYHGRQMDCVPFARDFCMIKLWSRIDCVGIERNIGNTVHFCIAVS